MEYFIDGDPSTESSANTAARSIYTQTPEPQILQLPDLRPPDAELAKSLRVERGTPCPCCLVSSSYRFRRMPKMLQQHLSAKIYVNNSYFS